jgi:threonine/homoserine/homoserine lactone efflux protein
VLGTHSLGVFALTVLVVNATPGVDMVLVLTRTLRHGVVGGIAAALGVSAGCVVHTLVAAFGLAALLAASAAAFAAVKWAGAAYLLWLAFNMLRDGVRPAAPLAVNRERAASPGFARLFMQGLATNVLNPKVAIFFLALLPQFIDTAAPNKTLAFLFLGGWFIMQGLLFLLALIALVAPLRRTKPRPWMGRGLNLGGAGLFTLLAAKLALTKP